MSFSDRHPSSYSFDALTELIIDAVRSEDMCKQPYAPDSRNALQFRQNTFSFGHLLWYEFMVWCSRKLDIGEPQN